MAIGVELYAISKAESQVGKELDCRLDCTVANFIGEDHTAIYVRCRPCPYIAST